MNRRQVSFLLAGAVVLIGLSGCSCTRRERVNYVPPPRGMGPCDSCAANGPLPPRYAPPSGPGPAVPLPPGVAAPPSGPANAVPFSPGAAAPSTGPATVPNAGIQQNNYIAPGITQAPAPPSGVARAYLEQPEAAASTPPPVPPNESRPSPPQTPEPPPARDDRAASPALPVDIPQFATVKTDIASGQEPYAGGVAWLKTHGYRTVLHVRAPGEDDSTAKRTYEQSGLRYLSLEVSPQTLSRARADQFNQLVADANNRPLFVYDKDGSLAGGLWYLYFRLAERATPDKAREEAERLGLKQDRSDAHLQMWLAVQKLLTPSNG